MMQRRTTFGLHAIHELVSISSASRMLLEVKTRHAQTASSCNSVWLQDRRASESGSASSHLIPLEACRLCLDDPLMALKAALNRTAAWNKWTWVFLLPAASALEHGSGDSKMLLEILRLQAAVVAGLRPHLPGHLERCHSQGEREQCPVDVAGPGSNHHGHQCAAASMRRDCHPLPLEHQHQNW
eukprot:CAMPEP_0114691026 /NCGR_PEP_ID=MMETSP0191-20121206/66344_1 /TAXON_ID=126664 /ORGANISM="Sorites sp." /LENGTH=183 /DNA_ID=CAMNT_0001981653 /DNA_START=91 /DNA_END=640 /DNA_ORIENTATION=-